MAVLQKDNRTEKKNKKCTMAIAICAVVLVVLFCNISMILVTNRIIDFGVQNMKVLCTHDAYAIESEIRHYRALMDGIATEIHLVEGNEEERMQFLNRQAQSLGNTCASITLVSDDSATLDSHMQISQNETIRELCRQNEGDFVNAAISGNILLIGAEMMPLTINGHIYNYLVAALDIRSLQDVFKLDSYNSHGLSYVINSDGYYIFNEHRDPQMQNIDNFYKMLETEELSNGVTIPNIQEKIRSREDFVFQYLNKDTMTDYIAACIYMNFNEWYYVSIVEREVFVTQSSSLMKLFFLFMGLILLIISVSAAVIFIRRSKTLAMERRYRTELTEALEMAQSAIRAKSTFLSNISHNMRTPMNAIVGFTTLAAAHADNKERVIDYMDKISNSSNQLLFIINDVLDMSHNESGKVNINPEPENLAEILHSLRDIIINEVNEKKLKFHVDIMDVRHEDIICDKQRLNQLLLYIISNALKFTPPGGTVSICVSEGESAHAENAIYEFRIKDSGIGMSSEFIAKIFEPFSQENNNTVNGFQGTGLGMTIAKNIVEMMGGNITVTSKQNAGSEFVVTLKFPVQNSCINTGIPALENVRCLVVDDNKTACQSICSMLIRTGLRCEWCMDGVEAVDRAKEEAQTDDPFLIYFINWHMQNIDGIETTMRIREFVDKSIPIFLLSAYDLTDIEDMAKKAGITEFINKPLFLSDLHKKLMEVCVEAANHDSMTKEVQAIDFKGKRLLVVDDIELNREVAREILNMEGFLVEEAENGSVALNMLAGSEPGYYDAILTDIQMPVMNGYDETKAIRQLKNKQLADIPIIAVTASAFDEERQLALDVGMNAVLDKPIDVAALTETLKDF